MKECSKCQIRKPVTDFFLQDKKSGRLHAQCKDCYKAHRVTYAAEHYIKYGDEYRLRAKVRRAKVKKELQSNMLEYLKTRACEICGENDIRVLEFDHLNPKIKLFGISNAIGKGMPWASIASEIKKCRVLCANCHRKHTAVQQGWYGGMFKEI